MTKGAKRRFDESDWRRHDSKRWLAALAGAGDATRDADMDEIRKLRRLVWMQTQRFCKDTQFFLKPVESEKIMKLNMEPIGRSVPRPFVEPATVRVVQADMLEAAGQLHKKYGGNVAVLNMANATRPGGGVNAGAGAQEEDLHRRSDLYRWTIEQERRVYPLDDRECLFASSVSVFRGPERGGYEFLRHEDRFEVSVLSCAAVKHPALTAALKYADGCDATLMKEKIELILQVAASKRCNAVVLSAFGCGAFGNPPEQVARMFKEVLGGSGNENELRFHVREFVFCILEDHNSNRHHNPKGNLQPFMEVLHPVLPPSTASVPVDVSSADVRSDARAEGFLPLRGTSRFQRMLI